MWTSGDWSQRYSAANLIDGDTNTLWVGNAGGAPWDITLDLGRVLDLTSLRMLFLYEPWTNIGTAVSEDAKNWFDAMSFTNDPLPCRYLYFQFRDNPSRAIPPAVREIKWEARD